MPETFKVERPSFKTDSKVRGSDTSGPNSSQRDFEQNLFVAPNGAILYAEPRLLDGVSCITIGEANEYVSTLTLAQETCSYVIATRPEFGSTTLGKRLVVDINFFSQSAVFRDANSLPNYKKKLEDEFSNIDAAHGASITIIIDNIDFARDEKLIKEIVGLKKFDRYIFLTKLNDRDVIDIPVKSFIDNVKLVTLTHLDRSDIRSLAVMLFHTSDSDYVSSIVEKVYVDLLSLCIPLTPSNIIMYLSVLHREGDFYPMNRVQIVDRYINDLLRRPSDAYEWSFNVKNKLDVLSSFVYSLYLDEKTSFSQSDWHAFCQKYRATSLIDFDETALLTQLLNTRVIIKYGNVIAFKYRFFYSFFLGRYVANRGDVLTAFINNGSYMNTYGLVETIADLTPDNTVLTKNIVERLEAALREFEAQYIPVRFDPFLHLQWADNHDEEAKLWGPLHADIAAGPRDPREIDNIKRSIPEEHMTYNQIVTIKKYEELRHYLFSCNSALMAVLKSSDGLDGALKKRAVMAIFGSFMKVMQLGVILSQEIDRHTYVSCHGLLFINAMPPLQSTDPQERAFFVCLGVLETISRHVSDLVGSRKLGEVFKSLESERLLTGFICLLNYICIIRAKPKNWLASAEAIIMKLDKNSYYLKAVLDATVSQFKDEVNMVGERKGLERLIGTI